jgi:membrane fusion protein, multidrug efflux system
LIDRYTGNLERDQVRLKYAQANLTSLQPIGDRGWAAPQLIETRKRKWGAAAGYQDKPGADQCREASV